MPTLARFYGIAVRLRPGDHAPAHVHVVYQEFRATLVIDSLEITRGRLPKRAVATGQGRARLPQV